TSLFPKLSPPNPHLNRVDPRIGAGNPRIRDVHEPHFGRPVVLFAQKVRAKRPLDVKFTCEVISGTFVFVNSVPPSISKYGLTFFADVRIHLNANGFTPAPYAVFVLCTIAQAGTTSSAYSSCPRRKLGPCGDVITMP